MKNLAAKILVSATLGMAAFTSVYADNHSPFPTAARELGEPLPSTLQYFSQRPNIPAGNSGISNSAIPSGVEENTGWQSPALLRYLEQREAAVAKEWQGRRSGRFDYIPRSNSRQGNTTLE